MGLEIRVVDAFTAEPFRGNPAAVCYLDEPHSEEWMQLVAREMNLSETAFVAAEGEHYRLRWFTPKVEVDLCGHATLASAHVLWETGRLPADRAAEFETRSGRVRAERRGDWIELDFPIARPSPADAPAGLLEALGLRSAPYFDSSSYGLVEVAGEDELASLAPDFGRLRDVVRAVIVTCRATAEHEDFRYRFFAPQVGIDEDPVTGSANCVLAPYWSAKLEKSELVGYQASERGGTVRTQVRGERVAIAGKAVTTLRCDWLAQT